MGKFLRGGWPRRAGICGGLAVLLSRFLAQATAAETPSADGKSPSTTAPVHEYTLGVGDCLHIALEQQPTLAAHRASLAAAEAGRRGLDNLGLAGLLAHDLSIRRKQAARGVTIAGAG